MSDELLFNKYELYGVVQSQTEAVKKHVRGIPANTLLNASEHDLIASDVEEFRLDVPTLKEDEIHIAESVETQIDVQYDPMRMVFDRSQPCLVPGTKTVIAVPFAGNPDFFRVRPQTHTLNPPRGNIGKNEILLTYTSTNHDGAAIKTEYQRAVSSIKDYLTWLAESAAQFNSQLEGLVTSQVKARKERLLADAGMTAAIGLPLRKREGMPVTYSVPVKRRAPKIMQPTVSEAFKREPALANEEYEEILRIMTNMVRVMELSPHRRRIACNKRPSGERKVGGYNSGKASVEQGLGVARETEAFRQRRPASVRRRICRGRPR
jgi:hypothetical protein